MYFKGLRQLKTTMEMRKFEDQCDTLYTEAFEDLIETVEQDLLDLRKSDLSPDLYKYFIGDIMEDLRDLEKKFQVMRMQGYDLEDMRCVLEGWTFQYHCGFYFDDEPRMESVPYHRPAQLPLVY